MWQVDVRSVALCVRDCLPVLLNASIDTTAQADSDPTSSQLSCGWENVTFIHSLLHKSSSLAARNAFSSSAGMRGQSLSRSEADPRLYSP